MGLTGDFKGRNIRPLRFLFQLLALGFVLGQLFGIPPFGSYPVMRRIFLPNASCRYINDAPTSCYYYQLQDGLAGGWSENYLSVVIMLAVVILMIILMGRFWCSWLCPFGLVQEGMDKLRELLKIPRLPVNFKARVILRRIKYALIFLTILITIPIGISALGLTGCQSTLALPFCQVCPAKGFFTFTQQIFGLEPWSTRLPVLAVISLALFMVSTFFIPMAFCRICPMGGLMALFSRTSLPLLRKDPDKCTKCRICTRICPLDHDRVYDDMETDDVGGEDCTLCGKCVEYCPEEGCLSLNYGPFTMISSKRPKRRRSPLDLFGKGGRNT
jgi:ferredoxin